MKDLVYPAVVYKDENDQGFTIAIHDLGIVTDGETIVDAYIKAKEYLCAMVDCAIKFDCDIEAPSDFRQKPRQELHKLVEESGGKSYLHPS